MSDQSGISALMGRVGRRQVTPSKHPRSPVDEESVIEQPVREEPEAAAPPQATDPTGDQAPATLGAEPTVHLPGNPVVSPKPRRAPRTASQAPLVTKPVPDSTTQISARITHEDNSHFEDIVYLLNREDNAGVDKTEMIRMFISELPKNPNDELRARLQRYRARQTLP